MRRLPALVFEQCPIFGLPLTLIHSTRLPQILARGMPYAPDQAKGIRTENFLFKHCDIWIFEMAPKSRRILVAKFIPSFVEAKGEKPQRKLVRSSQHT
jgi:hypothetical protein